MRNVRLVSGAWTVAGRRVACVTAPGGFWVVHDDSHTPPCIVPFSCINIVLFHFISEEIRRHVRREEVLVEVLVSSHSQRVRYGGLVTGSALVSAKLSTSD